MRVAKANPEVKLRLKDKWYDIIYQWYRELQSKVYCLPPTHLRTVNYWRKDEQRNQTCILNAPSGNSTTAIRTTMAADRALYDAGMRYLVYYFLNDNKNNALNFGVPRVYKRRRVREEVKTCTQHLDESAFIFTFLA